MPSFSIPTIHSSSRMRARKLPNPIGSCTSWWGSEPQLNMRTSQPRMRAWIMFRVAPTTLGYCVPSLWLECSRNRRRGEGPQTAEGWHRPQILSNITKIWRFSALIQFENKAAANLTSSDSPKTSRSCQHDQQDSKSALCTRHMASKCVACESYIVLLMLLASRMTFRS